MVLPNGRVAIAFGNLNQAGNTVRQVRSQRLVTIFDPDTGLLEGPYHVANAFDGANDYPVPEFGGLSATLCNSNFFVNGVGNVAVGKNGALYLSYSDDRKQAGRFPNPTPVGGRA